MKFEHLYFEKENGVVLCDYDLWIDDRYLWSGFTNRVSNYVYNRKFYHTLVTAYELSALCDNSFLPDIGDEIYVAPGCPYASADIRRNYKVKREPDAGVCNIIHPFKDSYECRVTVPQCLIVPSLHAVFASDDALKYAKNLRPDVAHLAYELVEPYVSFGRLNIPDVYIKFIEGKLAKPTIFYDRLRLQSENKLTVDILRLVYETAKVDTLDTDSYKNLAIQLNVMNQSDWRDYPGTVSMLNEMITNSRGVGYSMKQTQSRYPKPIREILSCVNRVPVEIPDKRLGCQFLSTIMGIEGEKFVHVRDLIQKCIETHISVDTFSNFFYNVVKIKPII